MKILIDNGHGAETPGKRSPDGRLREYAYCREIAGKVVARLKARGYDAELLVPEQNDVPLATRCARVNAKCRQFGARNVLLVSIHNNAAGSGTAWMTARGWEAWTSRGNTRSDLLAEQLYLAAARFLPGVRLRKDLSDGDADKESDFAVLRRTLCAACLTENLFQDNREDVAFLLSDAGRRAIVDLHVEGIIKFINS